MPYLEPVVVEPRSSRPTARPIPAASSGRQRLEVWLVAAGLALVLLGSLNIYAIIQLQLLQQGQQKLAAQFEDARTVLVSGTPGPALHRDLLPNESTAVSPEAHAVLIWDSVRNVGSLYVTGLPPLALHKTYQLWLVRDDQELSLGTFRVDATGTGQVVFESPQPIVSFQHIGVSEEPETGSPAPTTPHLVIGNI
jgi:anti-sigma-K factor RskA